MKDSPIRIGIIDDEKNIRRTLRMVLEGEGYKVWEGESCKEGRIKIKQEETDAVLLDMQLPDGDGLDLLKELRLALPGLPVVMISGHGTLEHAVEATKRGAYDFLEKPIDRSRLLVTMKNALEVSGLRRELLRVAAGGEMVGESPQMENVRAWVQRVAPTDSRVLILGESGTGKELVARAIHEGSSRQDQPFVKVNCAAIPRELVESVLFGHVKGAFTGALKDKIGTFKQADGGTLFLDEIADMGLEAQAKVLRVLQEGEFEPVGASKTEKVNVRVIAATHRDLKDEVDEGRFRDDLYYRLAVLVLDLPALREREGDVAVLTRYFFQDFHANGLPRRRVNPQTMSLLSRYSWPGNIRQLRNVVERMAILASQEEVGVDDLPHEIREATGVATVSGGSGPLMPIGTPLADVRNEAERQYLERVLDHTDWNVSEAARIAGVERTHLHKKLNSLGLKR